MFLRVETGLKSDFKDPHAERWLKQISKVHENLAEKIRWIRRLEVYWIELDAPRDRIVQTLQATFNDPVLNWLFTGDLLPSAAGPSGTLQDLMQAAPFRPGIFHGIEKRKRLQTHDEKAQVVLDVLQTVLGRSNAQDKVITGELLLLEGPKLTPSDLEWISRFLFTDEKFESWSFISEDELRKNSRFQSEQVAKYLVPQHVAVSAKWLQYRQPANKKSVAPNWAQFSEAFKRKDLPTSFETCLVGDEWTLYPKLEFSTLNLNRNTQNETEGALLKNQLEMNAEKCTTRLQSVLSVLPKKNRLWIGSEQGFHPERIWNEYFQGLKRIAETTSTPIMQVKSFEDDLENNPSFFWTSTIGVSEGKLAKKTNVPGMIELFWIGHEEAGASTNTIYVEKLKEAKARCEQADALVFSYATTGKTIPVVLQQASHYLKYGFDLVVDRHTDWFSAALTKPLSLSQLWGVTVEQKDWLMQQLKMRGIPFLHIGTSSLSGSVRVLHEGQVKVEMTVKDYFAGMAQFSDADLLNEPFYMQDPLVPVTPALQRFSTEELLIRSTPLVLRPKNSSWSGVMVLTELFDVSLSRADLEWMLRKCTAMGGQVHSAQVSMVNGLKSWNHMLRSLCSEFGIQLSQFEIKSEPQLQAHWCALQFVSTITDVRTIRSEDAKSAQERIYWLEGSFDQPAFRWLAGMEGRYQTGLSSAMTVLPQGMKDSLVKVLVKRKLGAEVKLPARDYRGGFIVTLTEGERFAIEEEWRTVGIEFVFLGKTATTPYLVIREDDLPSQTVSIEDARSMLESGDLL